MLPADESLHIIPFSIWIGSVLCLLITGFAAIYIYKKLTHESEANSFTREWFHLVLTTAKKPLLFVVITYAFYTLFNLLALYFPEYIRLTPAVSRFIYYVLRLVELVAFFWFVFAALEMSQLRLLAWAQAHEKRTVNILVIPITNSLKAAILLLIANMIIPELNLTGFYAEFAEKLAKILLVGVLAWIFVQIINGFESLVLTQYATNMADPNARKIQTQVRVLKRFILTIGIVVAIAAALMVFDSVRRLGTGLLTLSTIVGGVITLAGQDTLKKMFASLNMAFTQPVRIGDTVIIDGEFGVIEEITFSNIVVKTWDLRRLILPVDSFTSKGFQNLTHTSTQLLGTIFLYVDYTTPTDAIRQELQRLVKLSKFWDGQTAALDVTDMKERTLELRIVISAKNADDLWNVRCEIREKLVRFIVDNYIQYLPVSRNVNRTIQ